MTKLQHKMNTTKIFSSLFAIILLTAVVMAVAGVNVSPNNVVFRDANQMHTIVLTNTGENITDFTLSTPEQVEDGVISLSYILTDDGLTNISVDGTTDITVTLNGDPNDLEFGEYVSTLTVTSNDEVNNSITSDITLRTVSGFCSAGPVGGNLEITDVKIDNQDGDDDEWELLDVIEIEVEIKNNGDDEIEEVIVEFGLFDSNGNDVADDMDFENVDEEEIDLGDINDDDKEEDTFVFRIPADIDNGNYKLAIKAYSDDLGQSSECVDFADKSDLESVFFESIRIDRESDEERFVIVEDILMDSQATAGGTVSGTFTVFNIGEDDQERVLITMKNAELGLDQEFEITQDLDKGDDETLTFVFTVPANAENKIYNIEFRTLYDYRRGVYREGSEDTFLGFVSVIGGSGIGSTLLSDGGDVSVTATLGSDAEAGKELVVESIITNTGSETASFIVSAIGFQSWAELESISDRIITLDSGESEVVEFVFTVDSDASGAESFLIETNSNGIIETQEVEVNIGSGDAGGFSFGGDNSLVWIIAIVNIILIILIVLVAVRLSRR